MATSKSELNQLLRELDECFEKIMKVSDEYPSIMVYTEEKDNKLKWGESFSAICQQFEPRLQYFRRQVGKVCDNIPSQRGRKKSNRS